jgi:hypothetical protein
MLAQRGSPVASGGDHRVAVVARMPVDDRHWIASRSSVTSARRRARRAWVALASSALADASSAACGGWWGRRELDIAQSIERVFD